MDNTIKFLCINHYGGTMRNGKPYDRKGELIALTKHEFEGEDLDLFWRIKPDKYHWTYKSPGGGGFNITESKLPEYFKPLYEIRNEQIDSILN